jgi:hypothetical protein
MGLQTVAMFAGYLAGGAAYGQLQPGAIVGPLGALVIFAGGAMLVGSVLAERS